MQDWLKLYNLSVSTIGTNELQQTAVSATGAARATFSFHNRNERTATSFRLKTIFCPISSFSFHNRNERTATRSCKNNLRNACVFQFPQSERTNCNLRDDSDESVSHYAFSFHNRNERTATRTTTTTNARRWSLSVSTIGTNELQPMTAQPACAAPTSFSFHNRNERTATSVPEFACPLDFCTFSFHNRNERTATCDAERERSGIARLSVSTIGTNELQLRFGLRQSFAQFRLSVSTIGTNELQPHPLERKTARIIHFQFPQSERTNCN